MQTKPAQNPTLKQQAKYIALMCRKHLFVFSFGFIALLGLYNTASYGLASLSFYSVQNTVANWQVNRELQTEASYIKAKQAVAKARRKHTAHPLYTDLSAQIYEWGAIGGYEYKSVGLEVSKRFYMKAAKMRPTWPVTYASLAMNKWRSNEFDAELVSYLALANEYGPKKAEVNIVFVEMGLALYQSNHPFYAELRPFMQQRIAQGIRNFQSRDRVMQAIKQYDAQRAVCRWLKDTDEFVSKTMLKCHKAA